MSLQALQPKDRENAEKALNLYGLDGTGATMSQITVGFVNKTFLIEIAGEKFVLRQSHPDTTPEHLEFEIEILRFLESQAYALSPRVLPNSEGGYLTRSGGAVYMLQGFVGGEVRASWNDVAHFDGEMLKDFFRTAARFSKVAHGFKPSKAYPNEPLTYYTRNATELYESRLSAMPPSENKTYLSEEKDALLDFARSTDRELAALGYDLLPKQLVHFDLHPGNVHYIDDKVVGLFDFDWARMDSRLSDFAGAIVQSCYIYGGEKSGIYIKQKMLDGISAYREAYGPSELDPTQEQALLKAAVKGYVFFQTFWCTQWCVDNPDRPEGLSILKHFRNACLLNDYDELLS